MSGKAPKGLFVPLVTPFHADENIDYEGYKRVIDYVIEGGMDGVLVGGTTGAPLRSSCGTRRSSSRRAVRSWAAGSM